MRAPARDPGHGTGVTTYWLFWLLIAVVIAVFVPFAWHRNTAGFLSDDAVYLLMADFFSPFFHGNPLVPAFMMSRTRFPPALPVLIGLLGGGTENMYRAHLIVVSTFFASAALFCAWARRMLGARDVAAACLLGYVLLPRTMVYAIEIWSEYLYMAFVFMVFLLLDAGKRSRESSRELLFVCALVIGLAILTRTIGVALLAVFAVYLYRQAVERKLFYIGVAVVLPASWRLIKLLNHYQGGYVEDLAPYLSPSGMERMVLVHIPHEASLLLKTWYQHLSVTEASSSVLYAVGAVLLVLALVGLARRAAAASEDSSYVLVYLAIIVVWPHPAENIRFLYPLMPMALVYMFFGLSGIMAGTLAPVRPWAQAGLLGLVLLLILPNALLVAHRFLSPVPGYIPEDYRHTRYFLRGNVEHAYQDVEQKNHIVRLMSRVSDQVSPDECVYSAHPVSTMLYSKRVSILMPSDASIDKLTACRYLFVMNAKALFPPDYPLHRVDTNRLKLLDFERDRHGVVQAFLFRILH